MDKYFSRFQDLCTRILAQSDNCQESQQAFKSAKSVPELVTAWQFYWNGVLHEVPEQVLAAFNKFYPEYHDDIARAGIYFNESPATVPSASPDGSTTVPDASASGSEGGAPALSPLAKAFTLSPLYKAPDPLPQGEDSDYEEQWENNRPGNAMFVTPSLS